MKQNKTEQCYCTVMVLFSVRLWPYLIPKVGIPLFCQKDLFSKSPTNLWDDDDKTKKKEHDVCKIERTLTKGDLVKYIF